MSLCRSMAGRLVGGTTGGGEERMELGLQPSSGQAFGWMEDVTHHNSPLSNSCMKKTVGRTTTNAERRQIITLTRALVSFIEYELLGSGLRGMAVLGIDFEISLEIDMWLVDRLTAEQQRRQRVMEMKTLYPKGSPATPFGGHWPVMRNAFRSQSANPANSPNTSPAQPQPSTAAFLLLCLSLHALLRHSLLLLSQPDIFENQPTPTSLVIDRRPPAVTLIIVSRNLTTLRFPLLDQAPRFNLSLLPTFASRPDLH
ncbi:hypothetical protein NA56DRAFT_716119 [Hyaloscypha hepaticicola]|uniref:Uncharacterized protein n=1 Tax=Hyaloscypha hepaticicola TaxID=2082293 RepID=A0A2J6QBK4_9HELO|nr:hypothetical protein NA56DRAFT_716119 [Hyaloscypha hepaticicola]